MKFRRILGLSMAIVITASMASVPTVTIASPGHDDGGADQTPKKQSPKKRPAKPASAASAPAGAVGTLEAPRDIAISMTDTFRFDPDTIVVSEGETVRFLLDNPTVAPHDFLIGDLDEQLHHHEEMAAGEGHDDNAAAGVEGGLPDAVTLEPGESAEVIATFDEAGTLIIGCHVPGHWEAGMRGNIAIVPADQVVLATPRVTQG